MAIRLHRAHLPGQLRKGCRRDYFSGILSENVGFCVALHRRLVHGVEVEFIVRLGRYVCQNSPLQTISYSSSADRTATVG